MTFNRDEFYREVGLRLQINRKRKNLTQEEVAQALGVPRATYANAESGRQRIALDFIWKIAAVLRLPIDSLVPEPISEGDPSSVKDLAPLSGTAWLDVVSGSKR